MRTSEAGFEGGVCFKKMEWNCVQTFSELWLPVLKPVFFRLLSWRLCKHSVTAVMSLRAHFEAQLELCVLVLWVAFATSQYRKCTSKGNVKGRTVCPVLGSVEMFVMHPGTGKCSASKWTFLQHQVGFLLFQCVMRAEDGASSWSGLEMKQYRCFWHTGAGSVLSALQASE